MINLQAIRYFAMVARYEHYTKAANELYITQSTLSKAIEGLEDELGVKLFEKQGRNVRLRYMQMPTYRILDALLSGDIDIGFSSNYENNEVYSSICRELIKTEEIFLIVPEGHPLAKREEVAFEEIIDETWIGYNGDTGMATAIKNTAKSVSSDKKLRFSYFASEESAIIGLVRAGLGLGMITDSNYLSLDGVVKVHITQPCFFRNIYMVWN